MADLEKENARLKEQLAQRDAVLARLSTGGLVGGGTSLEDILALAQAADPLAGTARDTGFRSFVNPVLGEIGEAPGGNPFVAPGGRNLTFTGGSVFEPDFGPARLRNFGALLANTLEALRVRKAQQDRLRRAEIANVPGPRSRTPPVTLRPGF